MINAFIKIINKGFIQSFFNIYVIDDSFNIIA